MNVIKISGMSPQVCGLMLDILTVNVIRLKSLNRIFDHIALENRRNIFLIFSRGVCLNVRFKLFTFFSCDLPFTFSSQLIK